MDLSLENSSSKNADLLSPTKSTRSALNVSRFLSRKPASEQKVLALINQALITRLICFWSAHVVYCNTKNTTYKARQTLYYLQYHLQYVTYTIYYYSCGSSINVAYLYD